MADATFHFVCVCVCGGDFFCVLFVLARMEDGSGWVEAMLGR